jgi:hypothetical protein
MFQVLYIAHTPVHGLACLSAQGWIRTVYGQHTMLNRYTLSNKSPSAWYFVRPAQAATWRTDAIIIWVGLLSPYLRIRGVSLSSIHGWKRSVGNYQKLKTVQTVTIQSLTLSWVEAESLYKTNTVIKVNPIQNRWSKVKRTVQETWPVLPPRNSDELWALVSDAWDKVASSQHYIQLLIESMTRWIKSLVKAKGFWTSY